MSMLFEKTNIKTLELKNRLVRSATHEGMADENGFPTQNLFKLYERLSKGGVGLIITGHTFVSLDGKSPFLGMQGIDSDEHIPKYRELVDHVHQHGTKIAMQIVHCGRPENRPKIALQLQPYQYMVGGFGKGVGFIVFQPPFPDIVDEGVELEVLVDPPSQRGCRRDLGDQRDVLSVKRAFGEFGLHQGEIEF